MQTLASLTKRSSIPLIGVSFHRYRAPSMANVVPDATIIADLKRLGAMAGRTDVFRQDIEPGSIGTYVWSKYDGLVRGMIAAGITPVLILRPGNRLDTGSWDVLPATDAARSNVAAWAAALALRYGFACILEIENEPNLRHGVDPANVYAPMASAILEAVHAAKPGMRVILAGMGVPDSNAGAYLRAVVRAMTPGALSALTAITHHPYQGADAYASDPAMRVENVAVRLSAIRAAAGINKPVYVTEQGFELSKCSGVTTADKLDRQGQFVRRWVLSSLLVQGASILYGLYDKGTNPNDPEAMLGLIDGAGNLKPSGAAFMRIMAYVNACSGVVVSHEGDTYQAVFAMPEGPTTLRWSSAAGSGLDVTFPTPRTV